MSDAFSGTERSPRVRFDHVLCIRSAVVDTWVASPSGCREACVAHVGVRMSVQVSAFNSGTFPKGELLASPVIYGRFRGAAVPLPRAARRSPSRLSARRRQHGWVRFGFSVRSGVSA